MMSPFTPNVGKYKWKSQVVEKDMTTPSNVYMLNEENEK